MPVQDPRSLDTMVQEFREMLEGEEAPDLETVAHALGDVIFNAGRLVEDVEKTRNDSEDGFPQGLYRGNGYHAAHHIAAFAQARLAQGWHDIEEAEEYLDAHASVREYQH